MAEQGARPGVSLPRRPLRSVLLTCCAVIAVSSPVAAQDRGGEDIDDDLVRNSQQGEQTVEELDAVEAQVRQATDELVMLRARLDDAQGRLRQLDGQVALASQEYDEAEGQRIAAEEDLVESIRQLEEALAELELEEGRMHGQIASTYKYGPAGRSALFLEALRRADSPNDFATRMYELRSVVSYQAKVVDRVEELRVHREELRARAEATRRLARAARDDAAAAVDVMASLRDEAATVAEDIGADEARQAEILGSLQSQQATLQRVLDEVEAERKRLDAEAARDRARRAAAGAGLCAVDGAKANRDFSNDWGFPRPGGRAHEGTDIFANRGTPVRAMYAGTIKEIRHVDAGVGGIFVSYWTGSGEHWYNAHLDSVAPGLAVGDPVEPGSLIGTVGNSGNARTTPPHLHIGHYVDDRAVPPYPVLAKACTG